MAKVKIYHNPRCSKSRSALGILQERGAEIETIEYLKTTPSAAELDDLCKLLDIEPVEILRFKEPLAKELGLKRTDKRSRSKWTEILSENPKLIERPIVIVGSKAVIARPPEKVADLL